MRQKIILFMIGLLILFMGLFPLLSNFIPSFSNFIGQMPKAGTMAYQLILTLIGIIAIGNALKKEYASKRR